MDNKPADSDKKSILKNIKMVIYTEISNMCKLTSNSLLSLIYISYCSNNTNRNCLNSNLHQQYTVMLKDETDQQQKLFKYYLLVEIVKILRHMQHLKRNGV